MGSAASALFGGGTRHREALSVSVPHGIKRKFREEDQPVSILQDFLIASVRESESNLGCCVADRGKAPY